MSPAEIYAQKRAGVKAQNFKGVVAPQVGAKTIAKTTPKVERPGVAQNFVNKATSVAKQTLDIGAEVANKTGKFVINRVADVGKSAALTAQSYRDIYTQPVRNQTISNLNAQLEKKQQEVTANYRAGRISKENYTKALEGFSKVYQELSGESQKIFTAPSPTERAAALIDTATNVGSLGALTLAKTSGKEVGKLAVKSLVPSPAKQVDSVLAKEATKLEQVMQKIPSVKALVVRNANTATKRELNLLPGETADQYVKRLGKNAAFGLLVKQPIVYQTNIGGAQDVYNNILEGKYSSALKESAWLSTQMLNGGPIGAATKGFKWLGNTGGKLAYGQGSYIDEISKLIGNGSPTQIANRLASLGKNSPDFKKEERAWRIMQETQLRMANNNPRDAAQRTLMPWIDSGIDLRGLGPKEAADLVINWATANELLNTLGKQGKIRGINPSRLDKYVVVRWDVDAKNALAKKFEDAPNNVQSLAQVIRDWADHPGNAAGNNNLLLKKLDSIVVEAVNKAPEGRANKYIADKVREISAVSVMPKSIQSSVAKRFEKLGFAIAQPLEADVKKITPNVAYEDTRKLITSAIKGDEAFVESATPNPFVSRVARGLERTGLSPAGTTQIATKKLSQNVVANLANTAAAKNMGILTTKEGNIDEAGRVILDKLQRYLDDKQPSKALNVLVAGKAPGPAITDIRQLTPGEVKEALGLATTSNAREVIRAINKGYLETPMELRGLGDKIVDTLYGINPLHKYYSRIQSAMRYTYNPFFRTQEKIETSILSRAQARTIMWDRNKEQLDEGVRILDNSGLFKTGLSGQAAQDLVLGRVTATITQNQKRNLAGLAYKLADARGVSIDELVRNYGDDVGDALRVVVQYPNKGVLNSALARTLNIAFFPIRYNAKVTALAAQIISREPPAVQLAIINSIFDMKNWLKSPEGIQWQAEHADALSVFEWATPIGQINYWNKLFLDGDPNAIGDFGAVGGLPLGIITQMLDSQGIINLNTPYVNPSTGDVLPKYIPESAKAKASVALTDLLGSMFTYPGRILGLPGKHQTLNKLSQQLTGAEGVDFTKVEQDDRLTPLQKNMIRVLKGDTSDDAIDSLYRSPAPGQYNGYTLPPLSLPIKTLGKSTKPNVQQRSGLPTKAQSKTTKKKTPRVKTAQPIPQR